jgi:hypothetical protein
MKYEFIGWCRDEVKNQDKQDEQDEQELATRMANMQVEK